MKIPYGQQVNLEKLSAELETAGFSGVCWGDGFVPNRDDTDVAHIQQIIANHDPTPVKKPNKWQPLLGEWQQPSTSQTRRNKIIEEVLTYLVEAGH